MKAMIWYKYVPPVIVRKQTIRKSWESSEWNRRDRWESIQMISSCVETPPASDTSICTMHPPHPPAPNYAHCVSPMIDSLGNFLFTVFSPINNYPSLWKTFVLASLLLSKLQFYVDSFLIPVLFHPSGGSSRDEIEFALLSIYFWLHITLPGQL